ncbi:MAG TPA: LysE family translocator [Rhodanobacter sp.]
MHHLLVLCGLLGVAAITPGPNNLIVLHAAGRAGVRGAMPTIVGIVAGGLLLLAVLALGVDAVFAAHPLLRRWIAVLGGLYLTWLGMTLVAGGIAPRRTNAAPRKSTLPTGTLALLGFQFLNPKSWVMVLTVLAALPVADWRGYLTLAGLFVLIPTLCLLLWAGLGAYLARWLAQPRIRRSVDAVMGTLLVVCAVLLLTEP